jgi:CTP synthase
VRVSIQKLDPYINVDPGTMSPFQHGEVFVTVDGAETDLDLGHYERFVDINLTRENNVTTGQVYAQVIADERRGDYLGATIQTIPHITDEIKRRIRLAAEVSGAEVMVVEIGGTVGDIEGLPFLEAIRQMRTEEGRENTVYIHVTFLPYIGATGELKTKPTQHSVRELRSIGIQPQVIVARTDHPVTDEVLEKISLFCDVEPRGVIAAETASALYEVPLSLEDAGLGDYLAEMLGLEKSPADLREWRRLVAELKRDKPKRRIAIVGKYVQLQDAYMSVREALTHAAIAEGHSLEIDWVYSGDLERDQDWDRLDAVDGIVVPGGFGERGVEGKILAARWARERKIPYLGLCLGMQVMCIEFARNVLGHEDANSAEFVDDSSYPIIDLMPDQYEQTDKGGTMRLGHYPCRLEPGSLAHQAYNVEEVQERHRHRFEVNNNYREEMKAAGMGLSGLSPDGRLVEITEIIDHPFMVGSQFHPEFQSRPGKPHPLFASFIRATIEHSRTPAEGADQPRKVTSA